MGSRVLEKEGLYMRTEIGSLVATILVHVHMHVKLLHHTYICPYNLYGQFSANARRRVINRMMTKTKKHEGCFFDLSVHVLFPSFLVLSALWKTVDENPWYEDDSP